MMKFKAARPVLNNTGTIDLLCCEPYCAVHLTLFDTLCRNLMPENVCYFRALSKKPDMSADPLSVDPPIRGEGGPRRGGGVRGEGEDLEY
jgi:hypothetical protein